MASNSGFSPNWCSPPGDTIRDILDDMDLPMAEFSSRMEKPLEWIEKLVTGHSEINHEISERLESVLGASSAFWMNREAQYREDFARLESEVSTMSEDEWLRLLPLKDMNDFGWLEAISNSSDKIVNSCLQFFDIPDVETWHRKYNDVLGTAAFRTSPTFDSKTGADAAWLRQGEIASESIDCKAWNAKRFEKQLSVIRALTKKKNPSIFIPDLQKLCAKCGVAVVIVRGPKGCRASGATRFISPNKALILLSFRYLSDDHFWFTFFHEAAHLLLHGKKALFLEGPNMITTKEEEEANEHANVTLIPTEFQPELRALRAEYKKVLKFARRVGISPGIVVGQLQHLGLIKHNQLNKLKRRFEWSDD